MIFSVLTNKLGGYYNLRNRFINSNSKFLKKGYLFINRGYQHETNSFLPFYNTIKGPINFLHGTYGIFISSGAVIGKNCTIYQQVTIGSNMLIDSNGLGSPVIGDNCLIGAGAKIIGNINVGNNCRIGANAVVTKDLPDNSVIVLSPPKIHQKENLENKIYQMPSNGWGYMKDGKFEKETNEERLKKLSSIR
jgi:serine O-acetyltransferase